MADTLQIDRWEVLGRKLQPWFDAEMADLFAYPGSRMDGGLLMGCPIWGREYIERFTLFCLPSVGSPKSLPALANRTRIVLFIEPQARPMLFRLTAWLREAGVEFIFREIPQWVLDTARDFESQFIVLGCAQNLLTHMAGRYGMGFHMLMPDHVYEDGYFARMFALAKRHKAIVQAGVSTKLSEFADKIEAHRSPDGYSLAIPGKTLGDWAVDHMHPESRMHEMLPGCIPDNMPKCHRLVWKGKDALHVRSCHINPVWLAPELTARSPIAFTSTLDTMMPEYIPADVGFYVPDMTDGMNFIEISGDGKPVLSSRVAEDEFASWVLCQTSFTDDYWPYFNRPSLMPITYREDGMTRDEIDAQVKQVHGILDKHRPALMAKFLQAKFGNRFDREKRERAVA